MARRNRIVINDGIYHITTRIANREMLFKSNALKDKIVSWMYEVADFSGVDLLSWCVMDNHLHLLVHVQSVPERYWLDSSTPPDTTAFSSRPPSTFARGSSNEVDCPRKKASVGFAIPDEELVERLVNLIGYKQAHAVGARWAKMRGDNRASEVEVEQERYLRRMYNISQFVKTLKERIATRYNRNTGHEGCLFQGRFHSVLVEKSYAIQMMVAMYIALNPVKAGIACDVKSWRWSSFALACSAGTVPSNSFERIGKRCQDAYVAMMGCEWTKARDRLIALMADRLPEGCRHTEEAAVVVKNAGTVPSDDHNIKNVRLGGGLLRVTQVVQMKVRAITRGLVIARSNEMVEKMLSGVQMGSSVGCARKLDVMFYSKLDWTKVEQAA